MLPTSPHEKSQTCEPVLDRITLVTESQGSGPLQPEDHNSCLIRKKACPKLTLQFVETQKADLLERYRQCQEALISVEILLSNL